MKAFILSLEAERNLDVIAVTCEPEPGFESLVMTVRELRSGIRFVAKIQTGHLCQD